MTLSSQAGPGDSVQPRLDAAREGGCLPAEPSPAHTLLLGIGNALHGDDGVGPFIAQSFQAPGWRSMDAGDAPENFISLVRRETPARVVLVDAAQMGCEPGGLRRIPKEKIRDVAWGTHGLPLSHLTAFLEELGPEVVLLGIQPVSLEEGEFLSPAVEKAARHLIDLLRENGLNSIPTL